MMPSDGDAFRASISFFACVFCGTWDVRFAVGTRQRWLGGSGVHGHALNGPKPQIHKRLDRGHNLRFDRSAKPPHDLPIRCYDSQSIDKDYADFNPGAGLEDKSGRGEAFISRSSASVVVCW
ncbi:expressed unknown protein [Seminavis robusta]|uniref:Uncharacterized protein n=1 Tax=Seminavis robusta TaxID=568900 RepID=A0A9N8H610_9STRA|nr:expressed unknown protein [Seminavis robusta]|eukprot:Sro131_g062280.1 n/a (122) ;mRNA; f:59507-60002